MAGHSAMSVPTAYMPPAPRPASPARLQGMVYSDEYALSFHMTFHRLLKWFVALPLAAMAAALLALTRPGEDDDRAGLALPTHLDSHTS